MATVIRTTRTEEHPIPDTMELDQVLTAYGQHVQDAVHGFLLRSSGRRGIRIFPMSERQFMRDREALRERGRVQVVFDVNLLYDDGSEMVGGLAFYVTMTADGFVAEHVGTHT